MLRLARFPPTLSPTFSLLLTRNLASSGLLTRAWQNDTIADLRSEAKLRGLSAKGSKLALASRIEEYERNLILQNNASGSRHASSAQPSPFSQTEVPGNPELPPVSAADIFNIRLPEIPQVLSQDQIQIPYLPDYWNSSSPAISSTETAQEDSLPKIIVVAGAETHPGGGPSHNLLDLDRVDTPQKDPEHITRRSTEGKRTDSVFDDIAEDLGLPPVKDIKTSLWKLF